MFCTKCGKHVDANNSFCNHCGSPVRLTNSSADKRTNLKKLVTPTSSSPVQQPELNISIQPVLNFAAKYKWILLSITALIVIVAVVVKFLEYDPEAEAKQILEQKCNCANTMASDLTAMMQIHIAEIEQKKFSTRSSFRLELDKSNQSVNAAYKTCMAQAEENQTQARQKFIRSATNTQMFDEKVNASGWDADCAKAKFEEMKSVERKLMEAEKQIVEAEPDELSIKEKLLGQTVGGWRFDALSEFQSFTITNKIATQNRLEYTTDITVSSADKQTTNSYTNAVIVLTMGSDGAWYFNNLIARTFSRTFMVSTSWQKVTIPANCTYRIDTHGQRAWVKEDSWYPTNYKLGPDGDNPSLHNNTIFLASREPNQSISITLNFTAN